MSLIQTQEKVLMQKNCKSFKSFFNHAREGKKIRNRKGLEEFSTLSFETFPLSQAPLNKPPCHRMACPPHCLNLRQFYNYKTARRLLTRPKENTLLKCVKKIYGKFKNDFIKVHRILKPRQFKSNEKL